jgi:fructokinase
MYIGVDIGGSKILVVAGNADHQITASRKIATPASAPQGIIEIVHLIEELAGTAPIKAIYIACPGPVDRQRGRILQTPNMGWEPTDLVGPIKTHFRVPVGLEKDANAAALSEAVLGAGQGCRYVLYVTVSTGIGTGIVIGGEIYHGAHDPEGGHITITAEGHNEEFETAVSGRNIKRRYGKFGYQITDPQTWDAIAKDLAVGLHSLITAISPEVVVIGGGVGVHYQKFIEPLRQHLRELNPLYPLPAIVPAKHTETAVAYGTLILSERLAS